MAPPPPQTMLGCCLNIYLHIRKISALPLSDIHQTDHQQPDRQKNRHADRQTDNRRQRKFFVLFFLLKSDSEYLSKLSKKFQHCLGGRGGVIIVFIHKKMSFFQPDFSNSQLFCTLLYPKLVKLPLLI